MTAPTPDAYGRDPAATGPTTGPVAGVDVPGAEDDPQGPRGQAQSLLRGTVDLLAAGPDTSGLSDDVGKHISNAATAVRNIATATTKTLARLDQLAADDLQNPAGVRRLMDETRTKAADELNEHRNHGKVAVDLAEAGLMRDAQPAWPKDADRVEGRERLKLLLDAEPDAGAAAGKLRELVAGSDPVLAALAVSAYAQTYLAARGAGPDLIGTTRIFAAQAGISSDDPKRQAAGRALAKLDQLTKARLQAENAAVFAIGMYGGGG